MRPRGIRRRRRPRPRAYATGGAPWPRVGHHSTGGLERMRVWAIVLAAGRGERMGGPKAVLTLRGESFLALAARALARPGVEGVLAVLGHEADRVARVSTPEDYRRLLREPRSERPSG